MDHRYRLLLTPDQKYRARMHLCKTWKRITGLQQNQCSSCIPESTAAPTSEEPDDALEEFLKTKEAESGAQSHLTSEPGSTDIALLLELTGQGDAPSKKHECVEILGRAQRAATGAVHVSTSGPFCASHTSQR
ncbi:hypothetical protein HPB49_008780 [Dermacentor silvarum]|uniref:Uncharacterized protein n=1 Tax=Dermacentor silvarum TaxID=543639 RepID=A0ACB8DC63_DERSI|nr:hypothetical protein HPB49_008780 [Dermacentor silvarum]